MSRTCIRKSKHGHLHGSVDLNDREPGRKSDERHKGRRRDFGTTSRGLAGWGIGTERQQAVMDGIATGRTQRGITEHWVVEAAARKWGLDRRQPAKDAAYVERHMSRTLDKFRCTEGGHGIAVSGATYFTRKPN